jgi:hypothetical protein
MRPHGLARTISFVALASAIGYSAFAQEARTYWYWVQVSEGPTTQFYRGTSPLDEKALLQALRGDEFLRFNDLTFVKCDVVKDWSDHNPELKNHVLVNPRFIISVHPLAGNPRQTRKKGADAGCKP